MNDDVFEYVLRKRGTATRKRVKGFASAADAADAAQRELDSSVAFDDFRVYVQPGGDAEYRS